MTNADRIRSMDDAELAELTLEYDDCLAHYICSDGEIFYMHDEAIKHEVEWLQSEVKDGD